MANFITRLFRGKQPVAAQPAPSSGTPRLGVEKVPVDVRNQKYSFIALSPSKVGSVLRNVRNGYLFDEYWELLADIYDKDLAISSLLDKRFMAVALLPWEITPSDSDNEQSKTVAEFVRKSFEKVPRLHGVFKELAEAQYYGLSVAEIVWRQDMPGATQPGSGAHGTLSALTASTLRVWPRGAFVPKQDDDSVLQRYDEAGRLIALDANKWLVHKCTREGSLRRAGLGRSLIWYYMFKSYDLKDWISFLEAYGTPLRVGTYGPSIIPGSAEYNALKTAVIEIAVEQGVVIPEGAKIDFIDSDKASSTDAFVRFMEYMDKWISIRIVGGTLVSSGSDSGAGSRALGEVHAGEKDSLVEYDAKDLADSINQYLVAPLVALNFGSNTVAPLFKFKTESEPDLVSLGSKLDNAVNKLGLPVSQNYAYEQLRITPPQEGETVLKGQVALPPSFGPAPLPFKASAIKSAGHGSAHGSACSCVVCASSGRAPAPSAESTKSTGNEITEPALLIAQQSLKDSYPIYQKIIADLKAQIDSGVNVKQLKLSDESRAALHSFMGDRIMLADIVGRYTELQAAGLLTTEPETK